MLEAEPTDCWMQPALEANELMIRPLEAQTDKKTGRSFGLGRRAVRQAVELKGWTARQSEQAERY